MMKILRGSVLTIIVFLLAVVLPAHAGGPEMVWLRYAFVDDPPIPVGEVVKFVGHAYETEQWALEWDRRLGNGHVLRLYVLEDVDYVFGDYQSQFSSSVTIREPELGDVGVIVGYHDFTNAYGQNQPDGIIDQVRIYKYRSWNNVEIALLDMARQFQEEAVQENLVVVDCPSENPPDGYLVDGELAQPGPWSQTYRVRPEGSTLSAFYELIDGGQSLAWEARVKPGQRVICGWEKPGIQSIAETGPWRFASFVSWMRPQWQPKELPDDYNMFYNIWGRNNNLPQAVLARLGFDQVGYMGGNEWAITFVYQGQEWPELPPFRWSEVPSASLSHGVYTATIEIGQPVLRRPDGDWMDEVRPGWDRPLLVVPMEEWEYFQVRWEKCELYRILRSGWSEATIHKAIWED